MYQENVTLMCEKICQIFMLYPVFHIFYQLSHKNTQKRENLICKYSLSEINRQIAHSDEGLKNIANFHVNFS